MIRRLFPELSLLELAARPVFVGALAAASAWLVGVVLAGSVFVPLVRVLVFVAAAAAGAVAFDRATLKDAAAQVRGAFPRLAAR
jgi:hypothetical protein